MDQTLLGHIVIAVLNLLTPIVTWYLGRSRGREERRTIRPLVD